MQLQTGTLLHQGEYRILSVLGQGGFGITYLGLQQGLERRVAIKEFFMKDLCNRNEEDSQVSVLSEGARQQVDRFRQKFLKEAKTLAALDNPHIIRIHNVFEENGTAYYVMEYIEDGSLKDLVNARGSLPEAEALGYIRQLADALNYLHRQKILHLDLKPANILLKGGQTAVLIDFGISKRYDEDGSQTSSTPAGISRGYAPLEQYNAGGVSRFQPCTDIYSLGATLYTLLTGEVPPAATDVNNDGLPALPSHISTSTARAIEKAMSPRPKDRPQSVEEFMKLLQSVDEEATKPGEGKVTPKERQKKSQPRKLRKIIGGVVAAMATVMLVVLVMRLSHNDTKEEAPAHTVASVVENLVSAGEEDENPGEKPPVVPIPDNFVLVPGGMLHNIREWSKDDGSDEIKYSLKIDSLYMDKYELTQGEYKRVMGSISESNMTYEIWEPHKVFILKGDSLPVQLRLIEAVNYCNKRSKMEGYDGFYIIKGDAFELNTNGNGYRLPHELEWIYAAQGGEQTNGYTYAGGNSLKEVAWYAGNSGLEPHNVGLLKPNEIGLYDMSGNSSEFNGSSGTFGHWYTLIFSIEPYFMQNLPLKITNADNIDATKGVRLVLIPKNIRNNNLLLKSKKKHRTQYYW